ncbi:MAG: preprotein translocase subunit SecE [bacterium]|nr:preprotein translocase subunit SecE [bacterium]
MLGKIRQYLKESRDELRKVNWPTRRETVRNTLLVIGISIAVAVFLGVIDFGLNQGLETLLQR